MGTLRPKYLLYRHVEPLGEHGAFYCHHHVWYAYAFLTGFVFTFVLPLRVPPAQESIPSRENKYSPGMRAPVRDVGRPPATKNLFQRRK